MLTVPEPVPVTVPELELEPVTEREWPPPVALLPREPAESRC